MLAPVGGFRFGFFSLEPGGGPSHDDDVAVDIGADGMHETDTVDMGLVVSGEIVLCLPDGSETVLRQGDTLVQNGTRHRWENRTTVPAVLAFFNVGSHRTR
jgi:hypothetical protein